MQLAVESAETQEMKRLPWDNMNFCPQIQLGFDANMSRAVAQAISKQTAW